jgi:hypothetical protein
MEMLSAYGQATFAMALIGLFGLVTGPMVNRQKAMAGVVVR